MSTEPAGEAPVDIFDTTLREGSQKEGLSLTVDDKLRVAAQLDLLGVPYIEGGWPGANPRDDEFFERAPAELHLDAATLVAFGTTRRPRTQASDDENLANLVKANTSVVSILARAWDRHVQEALRTDLHEALAMAADSIEFLRHAGLRVFLDAEHFFDGYRSNPDFALRLLAVAQDAGAEVLVLCDTNGGTLPHDVAEILSAVRPEVTARLGVHFRNDAGCAVSNSLLAVREGATHVQGCINGYGERAGTADLTTVIANLSLKMGRRTIPGDRLDRLTPVAHHIAELVNVMPNPQQPYVGQAAFTRRTGLLTPAAVRRRAIAEHLPPEAVGNTSRVTVSELAGRSTIQLKAQELGLELDAVALVEVLERLKRLEQNGYHFEVADGSLELLMREATGWAQPFFRLESYRVIVEQRDDGRFQAEATVKLFVPASDPRGRVVATAEGNGPVNALDAAVRQALGARYPMLAGVHLTDYKVRVLDTTHGTAAVTRVLIDSTDGERSWTTIGVSENIIAASWEALSASLVYALLHRGQTGV